MEATLNTPTEAELAIARLELHGRVRRARNEYLGQYRGQAAASVSETGGRGKAYARNQRARDKAEVFETALAGVSSAVARAARRDSC